MADPDLSTVKALIADDRAEVRRLVGDALRQLGITQVDSIAAGIAGTRLVALMAAAEDPATTDPDAPPASARDLITRFSHDVASPLMCVIALSELLVHAPGADAASREDLRQIHEAAREIANMVRALSIRAAS